MSDASDKRLERYRGQGQDGKLSVIVQQGQRAVSSADPVAQVPVEYRKEHSDTVQNHRK